jgi:hypothetical protein
VPAKKQKPAPIRAIPADHPTGAAERAATAARRFAVDLAGEAPHQYFIIVDRHTGQSFERKNSTRSEVHDECDRRNAQLPINPVSLGKLTRNPARVRKERRRIGTVEIISATEIVERLVAHPPTAKALQAMLDSGAPLNLFETERLVSLVLEPDARAALMGSRHRDKTLRDVLQQLARKFGIRRVDRSS